MTERTQKGKSLIDFPDTYCIVDIETTGRSPKNDSIIEVSALKIIDNNITDTYSSLVNNEIYDPFITKLTGITNEMLINAPDQKYVLQEFADFVGENIIVAYNANFDINFLYDNIMELLDRPFTNNFVDALALANRLLPDLAHHRLVDVSEYYNIDHSKAHRSLEDCITTFKVFNCLKKEAMIKYSTYENFKKAFETERKKRSSHKPKLYGDPVNIAKLTAETTDFDITHPLYNKSCVFTGKLDKLSRTEAAQLVYNLGGMCENSVTKKTNFLILGETDYIKNLRDNKTTKYKKALDYKLRGYDIEILSESVFYDMIDCTDDLGDN